jgi:phosphoglycerate dehydrogenase-like enzyme
MAENILNVWCNPLLSDSARALLIAGAKPHRLLFSPQPSYNLVAGPSDPMLAECDAVFGQPDPKAIMQSARLRWIHLTSASYTRYETAEFRAWASSRHVAVTNSSAVYANPCAEHVFAFMLAHARQLLPAFAAQLRDRSWETETFRVTSRLLVGQTVLLLGFGAIARRLVEMLAPFDNKIIALRRHRTASEGIEFVTEHELERSLAVADHVVNTLPEAPSTIRFVNADRIGAIKRGAVFYNVGRGATVDQEALLAALESQRLAAAYLDVTSPEPLPPRHALWSTRGCYITPHAAGGHDREHESFVAHFLENLRRFTAGDTLLDRVM